MKSNEPMIDPIYYIMGTVPNIHGFKAQLARVLHQHLKVSGSNPIEVLNFSGLSTQLLKLHS